MSFTCTGLSPSTAALSKAFQFIALPMAQSYNPKHAGTCLVWAVPLSLATTHGITLVFSSSAYLDVSVQRVSPPCGVTGLQPAGLPHSDTRGSMLMCSSPRFFAAYHVLRRLWEPRHPPYALLLLVARHGNIHGRALVFLYKYSILLRVSSLTSRKTHPLKDRYAPSQYVNERCREPRQADICHATSPIAPKKQFQ